MIFLGNCYEHLFASRWDRAAPLSDDFNLNYIILKLIKVHRESFCGDGLVISDVIDGPKDRNFGDHTQ